MLELLMVAVGTVKGGNTYINCWTYGDSKLSGVYHTLFSSQFKPSG